MKHLRYWGENYFALPFVLALLLASIALVNLLTGRPAEFDAQTICGWLSNAMGVCVVVTLTGLTQHFLFGYRSQGDGPALSDDIHDSCVTAFLLLLFSALVFGLLR